MMPSWSSEICSSASEHSMPRLSTPRMVPMPSVMFLPGMKVPGAELELSESHDGIMELPADAPIGAAYAAWAGLGDPMFEINLTPNRPDCTGVHGIARDLAAADMGKFKDPGIRPVKGAFPCPVKVTIEDEKLCPGFALRLVRGGKNGPSPQWLQQRLTSIGLGPIHPRGA